MWAVKLARRSSKQVESILFARVSSTYTQDWHCDDGPRFSSIYGIGSIGTLILGSWLLGATALCEDEKRAAAGQTQV